MSMPQLMDRGSSSYYDASASGSTTLRKTGNPEVMGGTSVVCREHTPDWLTASGISHWLSDTKNS